MHQYVAEPGNQGVIRVLSAGNFTSLLPLNQIKKD